jgi:L-alanine-DL-glutamate epimerase-like enolase superfamily enzyme
MVLRRSSPMLRNSHLAAGERSQRYRLHLAAAYPHEIWMEHFEWLEPAFNERLEIRDGKMWIADRPGRGF